MSVSVTATQNPAPPSKRATQSVGWKELYLKEDWWAIWLGLGIVIVAYLFFKSGSSIRWIAVTPATWVTFDQLANDFVKKIPQYLAQFAMWLAIFCASMKVLGHKLSEFIPSFIFVYVFSILIIILGAWKYASTYTLEPPLVALVLGMIISNFIGLPRWMDTGFRVEYYIKTGIVLLGATLPFTLVIWAGPTAILQATIISLATFLTIFFVGRKLGIDPRLCATLGAGGAVCGVSAAIAVGGAVGAKKEDMPVAIALVVIWAIAMIFFLPLVSRMLGLPTGVAGAWIGSSEFADAAGFAAAQAYGGYAGTVTGITGTSEQSIQAFTLMKVVGRDIWLGIWAFVMAIIATTVWESKGGAKPHAGEIWWRFPKFVIGFMLASIIMTMIAANYSMADFNKEVVPVLVAPIKNLRTWAFAFCFFSIGLTTRFRELAAAGGKNFMAFSAGALLNVILGFVMSAIVFYQFWANLGH
jgi:uncharacterized integral membrane protein (TIGR00698 family)